MSENEQIIELITRQTRALLEGHWSDISDFRNDENSIKVGFSHDIGYDGQERIIETTISFAKRIKDKISDQIDTDQMQLGLSPEADAVAIVVGKKRRGRPPGTGKKNVLETTLKSWPKPDPAKGDAA